MRTDSSVISGSRVKACGSGFVMGLLLLVIGWPSGLAAQNPKPLTVPQRMVQTLDQTPALPGLVPSLLGVGNNWTQAEDDSVGSSIFRMLESAQATSGESFDRANTMQVMITVQAWISVCMGKRFRAELLSTWEERAKRIELEQARAFADVSKQLALEVGAPSPAKAILFLAFQDGLFSADNWREHEPQRTIARLKSFSDRTQVSEWAESTGLLATSAAISITAVDELFAADAFQPARFEAALAAAKEILADRRAKQP